MKRNQLFRRIWSALPQNLDGSGPGIAPEGFKAQHTAGTAGPAPSRTEWPSMTLDYHLPWKMTWAWICRAQMGSKTSGYFFFVGVCNYFASLFEFFLKSKTAIAFESSTVCAVERAKYGLVKQGIAAHSHPGFFLLTYTRAHFQCPTFGRFFSHW